MAEPLYLTKETMPQPARPFEVIWSNKDGTDEVREGDYGGWLKYIAIYGYPGAPAPRWRYTDNQNPNP